MGVDWSEAVIFDFETKQSYRVIERYLLPGKNTGFVLVCSGRQVYHQYWSVVIEWLTELPESIHYEDRKGVIKFCQAIFKIHEDEQWDVASGVQDGYSDGWVKRRARRIDDDEDTCGK